MTLALWVGNVTAVEKLISQIFDRAPEHALQLHEALGLRCSVFASLVPAFREVLSNLIQLFGVCLRSADEEDFAAFVQALDPIRSNYNLRLSECFQLMFVLEDHVLALASNHCDAAKQTEANELIRDTTRGILCAFGDWVHQTGLAPFVPEENRVLLEDVADSLERQNSAVLGATQSTALLGRQSANASGSSIERSSHKSDKKNFVFADEFDELKLTFRSLISSLRCLMAIQAPDGFGKSQLLWQLLNWIDKGYHKQTEKIVLSSVHFSRFRPIPGWTWMCFLRRLFDLPFGISNVRERISQYVEKLYAACEASSVTVGGELRNAIPELCDLCGEYQFSEDHNVLTWRLGSFDALCKLIETLARLAQSRTSAPLSLVFEDVGNADEAFWTSLEALLGRLPPNIALNVVVTYNDQFTPKKSMYEERFFHEVRLHALTPNALNTIIDTRWSPCLLKSSSRQALCDASNGSPVVLENLLRRLTSEGFVLNNGSGFIETQPLTVNLLNDVMLFRSVRAKLSPNARELLDIVSVMGDLTGGGLLERFIDQHQSKAMLRPQVLTAATELDREGLCRFNQGNGGAEITCCHHLLRESVYDAIEPDRLKSIHDELAAILSEYRDTSLSSLWAFHLSRGHLPALAMEGWLQGIERCIQLRDMDSGYTISEYASELIAQCSSPPVSQGEQCRLALRRERLFWYMGREQERMQEIERLRDLEHASNIDEDVGPDEWGNLQLCLARYALTGGDRDNWSQTSAYIQRQPLIPESKKEIAQVPSLLYDWFDNQNSSSLLQLDKLSNAESMPAGARARAMHAMALIELEENEFAEALHHAFEAWRYFRRNGALISESWLLRTLAAIYWAQGRLNEAERLLRRALIVSYAARNNESIRLRLNFDLAQLYVQFGDIDVALSFFVAAEDLSGVMHLDEKKLCECPQNFMVSLEILVRHASLLVDQELWNEANERLDRCLALIENHLRLQRENRTTPDRFDQALQLQMRCFVEQQRIKSQQSNLLVVQESLHAIDSLLLQPQMEKDVETHLLAYLTKANALFTIKNALDQKKMEKDASLSDPDIELDSCFYELDQLYDVHFNDSPSLESIGIQIEVCRCLWHRLCGDEGEARVVISKAWNMLMARMTALNASSRAVGFLTKPVLHQRLIQIAHHYELPEYEKIATLLKNA